MTTRTPEGLADALEAIFLEHGQEMTEADFSIMLQAAAALRSGGWRPIAEAPKDGTDIWAFNGEQCRMHWVEGDGYALWIYSEEVMSDICPDPEQPTSFMPLPPAPESE